MKIKYIWIFTILHETQKSKKTKAEDNPACPSAVVLRPFVALLLFNGGSPYLTAAIDNPIIRP